MYPTLSTSREALDQAGWKAAVVAARPQSLASREHLAELRVVPGRASVITVCFNAAHIVEGAFRSVARQDYVDVEYIVVDGGSVDGTLELIEGCPRIDLAISMRDKGIADAFNRGAALASGEYIAFLNADDVWPAGHLQTAVTALSDSPSSAFVFGDLVRADELREQYYVMRGDVDYYTKLLGWPPEFNHPSFVTRRSVFEAVGLFDLRYRICMDLEWLLRVDAAGLRGRKARGLWVVMRCGGVSDQFDPMFKDVAGVLRGAGVAPLTVRLLVAKARAKTFARRALSALGGTRLADAIRKRLNPGFEAFDSQLVETARQLLRDSRPQQMPSAA